MARVKPLLLLALFAVMALLGYRIAEMPAMPAPISGNKENKTAETLAEARFFDSHGKETGLEAYQGKIVLLNLWATWCTPCIAELPSLERLQVKYESEGLQVLPIALDRNKDADAISAFLEKNKITRLSSWLDTNRVVSGKLNYTGVPTSLLLGRDGRLVKVFEGPYIWDEGEALAAVKAALATK